MKTGFEKKFRTLVILSFFFCTTDNWNPRALYYSPNYHVCHILWSLFKLQFFESYSALVIKIIGFLTHLPLGITPKNLFWSLSGYKELKLTKNRFQVIHFAGCWSRYKSSFRSSGMRRKHNFKIVFGFTSATAVLTFSFRFLSSPLLSLFLPFFSFAGLL